MKILIHNNKYDYDHEPLAIIKEYDFIAYKIDSERFFIAVNEIDRYPSPSTSRGAVDNKRFYEILHHVVYCYADRLKDSIDKYHEDAMSAVGLYPIKGPLPPMPKCKPPMPKCNPPKNQQTTQNESQTIESFWRDREIEIWENTFTTLLQTHKTIRTGELYNICAKAVEEFRKVFNPRVGRRIPS
jgi:hypothetical protein